MVIYEGEVLLFTSGPIMEWLDDKATKVFCRKLILQGRGPRTKIGINIFIESHFRSLSVVMESIHYVNDNNFRFRDRLPLKFSITLFENCF